MVELVNTSSSGFTVKIQLADFMKELNVCFGEVPEKLSDIKTQKILYQANKNEFLLKIPNTGVFYLCGNTCTIHCTNDNVCERDIQTFLYYYVIPVFLCRNEITILAASAIAYQGKAILLAGPVYSGRDALEYDLVMKGNSLISSGITIVIPKDDGLYAVPYLPEMLIWKKTLQKADTFRENLLPARSGILRFVIPVDEKQFAETPLPIGSLIQLNSDNKKLISTQAIKGGKKFKRIVDDLWYGDILQIGCDQKDEFSLLLKLSEQINSSEVSLFFDSEKLNELENTIIGLAEEKNG